MAKSISEQHGKKYNMVLYTHVYPNKADILNINVVKNFKSLVVVVHYKVTTHVSVIQKGYSVHSSVLVLVTVLISVTFRLLCSRL